MSNLFGLVMASTPAIFCHWMGWDVIAIMYMLGGVLPMAIELLEGK